MQPAGWRTFLLPKTAKTDAKTKPNFNSRELRAKTRVSAHASKENASPRAAADAQAATNNNFYWTLSERALLIAGESETSRRAVSQRRPLVADLPTSSEKENNEK